MPKKYPSESPVKLHKSLATGDGLKEAEKAALKSNTKKLGKNVK